MIKKLGTYNFARVMSFAIDCEQNFFIIFHHDLKCGNLLLRSFGKKFHQRKNILFLIKTSILEIFVLSIKGVFPTWLPLFSALSHKSNSWSLESWCFISHRYIPPLSPNVSGVIISFSSRNGIVETSIPKYACSESDIVMSSLSFDKRRKEYFFFLKM